MELKELADMAEEAVGNIRETLAPDGDWMPVLFVMGGDGKVNLVGLPGNVIKNDEAVQALGRAMREQMQAQAYAWVTTAWVWQGEKDSDELPVGMAVHDMPGRKEMVFIQAADDKGAIVIRMAEVHRRMHQPPVLGTFKDMSGDGASFSGRLDLREYLV